MDGKTKTSQDQDGKLFLSKMLDILEKSNGRNIYLYNNFYFHVFTSKNLTK